MTIIAISVVYYIVTIAYNRKNIKRFKMILYLLLLLPVLVFVLMLLPELIQFKKSTYKEASGNNYLRTYFNKGNYGEYLTYKYLEKLDCYKKILTNIYLPKEDGSTTEVDLVMLCQKGIFVFESKNYSGWIYGGENQRYWTQTFKTGQKEKFFNPIWQNKAHIAALLKTLNILDKDFIKSYIVFSERCELKNIEVKSLNVKVIKRNILKNEIQHDFLILKEVLSVEKINSMYEQLKIYCNCDLAVKAKHIEDIQNRNNIIKK